MADLVRVLREVKEASEAPTLVRKVRGILEATGLLSMATPERADQDTAGDLLKLVDIADALVEENPNAGLTDLLDFLALQSEADEADAQGASRVKMLTVHASKGLEFHSVFVVGMEDGVMPHRRATLDASTAAEEEERRLAYVAMTRAKANLVLTRASARRLYGDRKAFPPSRFLGEIPPGFVQRLRR